MTARQTSAQTCGKRVSGTQNATNNNHISYRGQPPKEPNQADDQQAAAKPTPNGRIGSSTHKAKQQAQPNFTRRLH